MFLDRLMNAESGGRQIRENPASTALGPFQFISSTFLDVIQRYFPEVSDGKSNAEILALRVDPKISRDAALAYTRANAAFLQGRGVAAHPAHLRLAFLVGPSGALNVIAAEPETPVSSLLSSAALEANPFMGSLTAKQLIERAEREAAGLGAFPVPAEPEKQRPPNHRSKSAVPWRARVAEGGCNWPRPAPRARPDIRSTKPPFATPTRPGRSNPVQPRRTRG